MSKLAIHFTDHFPRSRASTRVTLDGTEVPAAGMAVFHRHTDGHASVEVLLEANPFAPAPPAPLEVMPAALEAALTALGWKAPDAAPEPPRDDEAAQHTGWCKCSPTIDADLTKLAVETILNLPSSSEPSGTHRNIQIVPAPQLRDGDDVRVDLRGTTTNLFATRRQSTAKTDGPKRLTHSAAYLNARNTEASRLRATGMSYDGIASHLGYPSTGALVAALDNVA